MAVYDANGDGLNDVVSNLNAHGSGLAWFEHLFSGIYQDIKNPVIKKIELI
jgi:hypothetical protein